MALSRWHDLIFLINSQPFAPIAVFSCCGQVAIGLLLMLFFVFFGWRLWFCFIFSVKLNSFKLRWWCRFSGVFSLILVLCEKLMRSLWISTWLKVSIAFCSWFGVLPGVDFLEYHHSSPLSINSFWFFELFPQFIVKRPFLSIRATKWVILTSYMYA